MISLSIVNPKWIEKIRILFLPDFPVEQYFKNVANDKGVIQKDMAILIKIFAVLCCLLIVATALAPVHVAAVYLIIRPLLQPFSLLQQDVFGIPIGALPSMLLIPIAFLNAVFRKKYRFFVGHIIFLYLLLMFSILSIYNSSDYLASLEAIIKLLVGIGMFLLVYNGIDNVKKVRLLLWSFAVSAIIPILFGFYEIISGNYGLLHQATVERVSSVFGIGNAFGIYMSIVMIAILMLFLLETAHKKRMVLLVLLGLLVVLQVFALNRGTWIALFLGTLISSIFYKKKIQFRWFVLAGMLVALFFAGQIITRFSDIDRVDESGRTHNTFEGRVEYWQKIIPLIAKRPVIGYGVGTSEEVTYKYLKNETPPHNDYVRLALEIGVPGAMIYMLFLFFELLRNFKKALSKDLWQINYPMFILILYFSIISITQNIVYTVINFPMFTAMVGLSLKCNKLMRGNDELG